MDELIKEIVEQICVGRILMESRIDCGNRLALIVVDNAVEFTLKFYASYHRLLSEKELDSPQAFFSALGKISKPPQSKISITDAKDIRQYHNHRNDLYHRAKLTTVNPKLIKNYTNIAKKLFKELFEFVMSDAEWDKSTDAIRKRIVKEKVEIKEHIEFEKEEVEGVKLVRMKTLTKLKNTMSIQLIIYGFMIHYAKSPVKGELKKSLKISGQSIGDRILDARISELRKAGYIEKENLELKGKALKKLKQKFYI